MPPGNRAPAFGSTAPALVTAGDRYRYDTVATDPDGDPVAFDLPLAPAGMVVHPTLGVVVWDPSPDQAGTHAVVLRVRDDHGNSTLQTFEVTVTLPDTAPVITSAPPGPATVGLPYRYQVHAQDADGDTLAYSLSRCKPDWAAKGGV